jgi:hypothetical protein
VFGKMSAPDALQPTIAGMEVGREYQEVFEGFWLLFFDLCLDTSFRLY